MSRTLFSHWLLVRRRKRLYRGVPATASGSGSPGGTGSVPPGSGAPDSQPALAASSGASPKGNHLNKPSGLVLRSTELPMQQLPQVRNYVGEKAKKLSMVA